MFNSVTTWAKIQKVCFIQVENVISNLVASHLYASTHFIYILTIVLIKMNYNDY